MANWQERIRQILEEEKREIARKNELEREKIEEWEAKRLQAAREKKLIVEARSRESLRIFKDLQIQELLEEVKQDVWHVGTVKFAYDTLELEFNYESAKFDEIGWESAGREGGGSPRYGDKGHIVTERTYLGVDMVWREDGPDLRILDSERCIPLRPYLKGDPGGKYLTDFKHPQAHQWIEELFMASCVERTKKNCLPLDLKAQGKEAIERIVPWSKRIFRKANDKSL